MSSLTNARIDAKETLERANINVSEFIPERITPPLAIISAGDPYVTQETFTDFTVRLKVTLVAATGTNEVTTSHLDELIETALFNLGDWGIGDVAEPVMVQANNAQYLSTTMVISKTFEIEGGNQ